jgi:hypothetical protein
LQEVVQVVVESGNLYFRLKIRSQSVTTASRTINRGARMYRFSQNTFAA